MNLKFWTWGKKPKLPTPTPPPSVKQRLSPNYAKGRPGGITHLIMHNTAGPFETSLLRLLTPIAEVSAHYIVDRDGEAWQLVLDGDTAWHSGNRQMNQCSIGIEIVAYASKPGMTPVQAEAVAKLVRHLMQTYQIKRENILPHRAVKATLCPSFIWPTDQQFEAWKATL